MARSCANRRSGIAEATRIKSNNDCDILIASTIIEELNRCYDVLSTVSRAFQYDYPTIMKNVDDKSLACTELYQSSSVASIVVCIIGTYGAEGSSWRTSHLF